MLTKSQIGQVRLAWNAYISHGEKFLNASREFTQQELDNRRRKVIPEVLDWITRFRAGEAPLEEFKTAIDGINKRNRLWGFQGINGQMFFNILTKNSQAGNRLDQFTSLLKKSIPAPVSMEETKKLLREFEDFTKDLAQFSADRRGSPKVGSILYFLSYFWQIHRPEEYPVYYSSMINALEDLEIWTPSGEIFEDYRVFHQLNHEMRNFLSKETGHALTLWDIEHAFWYHSQLESSEDLAGKTPGSKQQVTATASAESELPESYIPPIVAVLPKLAENDSAFAETCQKSGRAIEKVFEERLAVLFRMLGFETKAMGQGQGRVPDGLAISQEYHYAVIYDAKVRQSSYTMGTDERAIREYISVQGDRLRRQGIRTIYFFVISSKFSGDHDGTIRTLKIETGVNEVLLVEVKALLALLEGKLRNQNIDLGPDGFQRLFASSGLITESDAREFVDI